MVFMWYQSGLVESSTNGYEMSGPPPVDSGMVLSRGRINIQRYAQ
jgi:hypothetical protein